MTRSLSSITFRGASRSKLDGPAANLSTEEVAAYYERKTQSILHRYGPGPRVHFHTGFAGELGPPATPDELRYQLRAAQEEMLKCAAEVWHLRSIAFREVLDVGCGLGGGAIFWAQEFGSDVTAITNAPSHVSLVAKFSEQANVKSRVHPSLCDALKVPGQKRFDAVIAIDSSCHLNRRAWFRRAADLLRPGGYLLLADCFLQQTEFKAPFDRHWCARIGSIAEYLAAARKAQMTLTMLKDASQLAANFWARTVALIHAEAQEGSKHPVEHPDTRESLYVHSLMRHALLRGGLRYELLSFIKL